MVSSTMVVAITRMVSSTTAVGMTRMDVLTAALVEHQPRHVKVSLHGATIQATALPPITRAAMDMAEETDKNSFDC